MGGWVQDGLAMKGTLNIKGSSGDKFCIMCSNARSKPLPNADDLEEEDIPGSHVTSLAECVLTSDQELLDSFQVRQQKQAKLSHANVAVWQQASGISWNSHALLLNQACKHASLFLKDESCWL